MNEQEAEGLTGVDGLDDAVGVLAGRCPVVVVTRGADGSVVADSGKLLSVPARSVPSVVDTTGAGDSFAAGFLLGVVQRLRCRAKRASSERSPRPRWSATWGPGLSSHWRPWLEPRDCSTDLVTKGRPRSASPVGLLAVVGLPAAGAGTGLVGAFRHGWPTLGHFRLPLPLASWGGGISLRRMERLGIVGLPNSGKSSLFNALTGATALVAAHPFSTTETTVGVAQVPDQRLDEAGGHEQKPQGRPRQRGLRGHRRPGFGVIDRRRPGQPLSRRHPGGRRAVPGAAGVRGSQRSRRLRPALGSRSARAGAGARRRRDRRRSGRQEAQGRSRRQVPRGRGGGPGAGQGRARCRDPHLPVLVEP